MKPNGERDAMDRNYCLGKDGRPQCMLCKSMEEKVKCLENSIQQIMINLKNKENILLIQTTQLQKMDTLAKRLIDENEYLCSKNRKQGYDIENLKIMLKGYEETGSSPESCHCAANQSEQYQPTGTNVKQAPDLNTSEKEVCCEATQSERSQPISTNTDLSSELNKSKQETTPSQQSQAISTKSNQTSESNVSKGEVSSVATKSVQTSSMNTDQSSELNTSKQEATPSQRSQPISMNTDVSSEITTSRHESGRTQPISMKTNKASNYSGVSGFKSGTTQSEEFQPRSTETNQAADLNKSRKEVRCDATQTECQAICANQGLDFQGSDLSAGEEKIAKVILMSFNAALRTLGEHGRGCDPTCPNMQGRLCTPGENRGVILESRMDSSRTYLVTQTRQLEERNRKLQGKGKENPKPAETRSMGVNTEPPQTLLKIETVETDSNDGKYATLIREIQELKMQVSIMRNSLKSSKVEEEPKENYQCEMLNNLSNVILHIYKEEDNLKSVHELFVTKFNESFRTFDAGKTSLPQSKSEGLIDSQRIVNSEGVELNKMRKKFSYLKQQLNDYRLIIDEYLNFKHFWAVQIQEIIRNTCILTIKINSDELIEPEGIVKVFKQMVRELYSTLGKLNATNQNLKQKSTLQIEDNSNPTIRFTADLFFNRNPFNKSLHQKVKELNEKYYNLSELAESKTLLIQLLQREIQEKEEEVTSLTAKLESSELLLKNNVENLRGTLANLKDKSIKFEGDFKILGNALIHLKAESHVCKVEIGNLKETFKIVHLLKRKNTELLEQNNNQREFLIQQQNFWGQILEDNKWLQCHCEQMSCEQVVLTSRTEKCRTPDTEFKSLLNENEFLKENFTYCQDCLSLNQIMGDNSEWQEKIKKLAEFISRRDMEVKVCVDQKLRASQLLEYIAAQNTVKSKLAVIKENSSVICNQVAATNFLADDEE